MCNAFKPAAFSYLTAKGTRYQPVLDQQPSPKVVVPARERAIMVEDYDSNMVDKAKKKEEEVVLEEGEERFEVYPIAGRRILLDPKVEYDFECEEYPSPADFT